ncbi:efflux RND transporter periplasmic adaptor subunit [Agrobacterium sp. NPDC089420]|uniref:efflux RND transporter periplasmic adaptor subunit n=1 Tax=Agrobacterium sp. NPDC089420 TaxID=3363918 RepID=UPI00385082AD
MAGIAILGLCAGAWFWQSREMPVSDSASVASQERSIVIEPQTVSQQLDITGTIAAGKSVAIVAPFDGVIREKRAQLGEHVNVGDVLMVMDTSEIAARYRDAQSAYIKAAMAADALEKWENGADMLRSRRSLEAAEMQLASLERQVSELKALLDQGIVSRNEYDGLLQQRNAQANTVAGAQDELASTQARGGDENRQLVMLDLDNAQSRLNDLKQQMAGAKIATAVAGILARPPDNGGKENPQSVEPGASVMRGAALFSIADTSTFTVTGNVDEIDVNRVKIGHMVTIVSDAFPGKAIAGRIIGVSAEADAGRQTSGAPSFGIRASFSVEDETLRQVIRIGMSARMTIETYSNQAALIVPPTAIVNTGSGPHLRVQVKGKTVLMPVLLGATFPQGVEVVSGINAGASIIE